jgi:uncharacterized RDD family membrane protein YckC
MTDNNVGGAPKGPGGGVSPELDEEYYVRGETEAYGPYDGRTIKDMIEQGRLTPNTGLARVGATEWIEVKNHPFFGKQRRGGGGSGLPGGEAARLPGAPGSLAQQVQGGVRYAGFWIRVGAYLIDLVILLVPMIILMIILAAAIGLGARNATNLTPAGLAGYLGLNVVLYIIPILYHVLFLRSRWHATPGKRLLGLHVVTTAGERLTGWRAFGRTYAYAFSAIPLFVGFMMIGWNKEKKALHDLICDTRVIYGKL